MARIVVAMVMVMVVVVAVKMIMLLIIMVMGMVVRHLMRVFGGEAESLVGFEIDDLHLGAIGAAACLTHLATSFTRLLPQPTHIP